MQPDARSDEQLLAAHDAASFARFYARHVNALVGYFVRRTHDAELAADLTAETFAGALAARHRYRSEAGRPSTWLYGIAMKKLADTQRRGYVERRAQRQLGMQRLPLTADDMAHIEALAGDETATLLVEELAPDQRDAIVAHIVEDRAYGDIAAELHTSEAVVRQRVSRGLRAVRDRMGVRR